MVIKAITVCGVYDNTEENKILNKEFLAKFNMQAYCTSYSINKGIGSDIVYGIQCYVVRESDRMMVENFIGYVKDNFNIDIDNEPRECLALTNVPIDMDEYDLDYTYDKFEGKEVKEYVITGTVYMERDNIDNVYRSEFVEEIFKIETILHEYELKYIQFDNDSDIDSYWVDICVKVGDDKVDEWFEKIKEQAKEYCSIDDLKIRQFIV